MIHTRQKQDVINPLLLLYILDVSLQYTKSAEVWLDYTCVKGWIHFHAQEGQFSRS